MAEQNLLIGASCKLYYNTGTNALPVWVLAPIVEDVSIPDLGINLAEVKLRSSLWTYALAGHMKAAIEFKLAYKRENVVFDAMRTRFFARTVTQFAVVDGLIATVGTQGLKFFGIIESFPIQQPLEGMVAVDSVRVVPAYHEEVAGTLVEPAWITI